MELSQWQGPQKMLRCIVKRGGEKQKQTVKIVQIPSDTSCDKRWKLGFSPSFQHLNCTEAQGFITPGIPNTTVPWMYNQHQILEFSAPLKQVRRKKVLSPQLVSASVTPQRTGEGKTKPWSLNVLYSSLTCTHCYHITQCVSCCMNGKVPLA